MDFVLGVIVFVAGAAGAWIFSLAGAKAAFRETFARFAEQAVLLHELAARDEDEQSAARSMHLCRWVAQRGQASGITPIEIAQVMERDTQVGARGAEKFLYFAAH